MGAQDVPKVHDPSFRGDGTGPSGSGPPTLSIAHWIYSLSTTPTTAMKSNSCRRDARSAPVLTCPTLIYPAVRARCSFWPATLC